MLNQPQTQSTLVGRKAFIKDSPESFYAGHHGFIKSYEGDGMYTLHNGSLGDMEPLLHRSEFTVHRKSTSKETPDNVNANSNTFQ